MSLKRLIDVGTVSQLLKKNIINKEGVRILDCSYDESQYGKKPDYKQFEKELYGKFDRILAQPCPSKRLYLSGHIPQAPHVCIDVATYPSQYERYAPYPPDVFQEYMRLVGVDPDEHLILYSRGKFGGMKHCSKMAWLLKAYGHEKLSLIDGGFDEWKKKGHEISKDDVKLKVSCHSLTFQLNLLDSRVRGQFEGTVDTGFPPTVKGTHIPGFKNLPAAELVEEGVMRSPEEVRDCECNLARSHSLVGPSCRMVNISGLTLHGFKPDRPTVVMCNLGVQAAMLAYAIETVFPHNPIQVYNVSFSFLVSVSEALSNLTCLLWEKPTLPSKGTVKCCH
ncbi:rhodanese-like protein [Ancylostoma ceylanicum]|uniref:Rhodanese-like protein n=1 Tax=Ancylostoma ceylanicum TaxID=53326 RepID=A0A0D6LMV6_9BILA|nr:rhodanese-like protein [Ancylostoma ceylanicum]